MAGDYLVLKVWPSDELPGAWDFTMKAGRRLVSRGTTWEVGTLAGSLEHMAEYSTRTPANLVELLSRRHGTDKAGQP